MILTSLAYVTQIRLSFCSSTGERAGAREREREREREKFHKKKKKKKKLKFGQKLFYS